MKTSVIIKSICVIVGFAACIVLLGDEPIGHESKKVVELATLKVIAGIVLCATVLIYHYDNDSNKPSTL